MSKKPSITQRVLEQYREQYGCDYDEDLASIRSMTAFIATNASRLASGTPVYHPWKMTRDNFYKEYTAGRFPDGNVPWQVVEVMAVTWTVMKVWHPEYPWIEEDDEWDEEPEDTEVMKDDREDEWE